jgi:hypothetical protein
VGSVVHFAELVRIGCSIAAPRDLRVKLDSRDRHLSIGIFLHMANRLVFV